MFGFSKKKDFERMEATFIKFQALVFLLLKDEKYNPHLSGLKVDERKIFIGALTNYLFATKARKEHLEKFEYGEISKAGDNLLENNYQLCEIIVQSVKVKLLTTKKHPEEDLLVGIYSSFLMIRDENFVKPTPDNYDALLYKANQWLPKSVLSQINIK
tara:strand:- start:189 stop:662 length:474 start_codon:yes stop_codon:yes gene_type:complete